MCLLPNLWFKMMKLLGNRYVQGTCPYIDLQLYMLLDMYTSCMKLFVHSSAAQVLQLAINKLSGRSQLLQ
jgi:hypothetical protein